MPAELNGVMLQAFHWFLQRDTFPGSNGRSLWRFLGDEADHFRDIGIDAIWIPPAYKAGSGRSNTVGYDVYDHFDLGEFVAAPGEEKRTKYGTREELDDAIRSLHGSGNAARIGVYADIVLNHKTGGALDDWWEAVRVDKENRNLERNWEGYESGRIEIRAYGRFDHDYRENRYSSFTWRVRHFDSFDTAASIRRPGVPGEFTDPQDKYIYRLIYNEQNFDPQVKASHEQWVSLEKGNYDYLTGCDMDYGRWDVREEMKWWGEWLVRELDLDGVRLDAVKHFSADFAREWLGHVRARTGKDLFAVGECLESTTPPLHSYLTHVTSAGPFPQPLTLFDFPLRYKFRQASWEGERFDLRQLSGGTLLADQPALAVTFVENHDEEFGRNPDSHVQEWFKPLAYAFILLRRDGYPVIFFPDYYGSNTWFSHQGQKPGRDYLDLLLKLRKQFALGEERYYAEANIAGWVRMGFVPGAKGAMAAVINTSLNTVRRVRMNTGRFNRRFYHLATIKHTGDGFLVIRNRYDAYGDQAEAVWTDGNGWGDFPAEGGTVAIFIEDGVGVS